MRIGKVVHQTRRELLEESSSLVQLQFPSTARNRDQLHLAQQRLNTWLLVRLHVRHLDVEDSSGIVLSEDGSNRDLL